MSIKRYWVTECYSNISVLHSMFKCIAVAVKGHYYLLKVQFFKEFFFIAFIKNALWLVC